MNVFNREPAVILGFVQAVLTLVIVLGVDLPDGAEAAILGVSAAVLALVTRSQVTPVADPKV